MNDWLEHTELGKRRRDGGDDDDNDTEPLPSSLPPAEMSATALNSLRNVDVMSRLPIVFLAHGYFAGTTTSKRFQYSDGKPYFFDALNKDTVPVSPSDAVRIWRLADDLIATGSFHIATESDQPRCCDIGVTRIYYGRYAAQTEAVPRLMEQFAAYGLLAEETSGAD